MIRWIYITILCLAATPVYGQDTGSDASGGDMGCVTNADCAEGEACNQLGECEFFDAVGDMGLGGGGGEDAGADMSVGADSGPANKPDDGGGCSSAGSVRDASLGLALLGFFAGRRRR